MKVTKTEIRPTEYACDVCDSRHRTPYDAEACEKRHKQQSCKHDWEYQIDDYPGEKTRFKRTCFECYEEEWLMPEDMEEPLVKLIWELQGEFITWDEIDYIIEKLQPIIKEAKCQSS